jgi:hypothetical protein
MLFVPLRQFQQKASFYLNKLPITLTRRGIPVAVVEKHPQGTQPKIAEPIFKENDES